MAANKIIVSKILKVSGAPIGIDSDINTYRGPTTCEFADGQTVVVGPDAWGGTAYSQVMEGLQDLGAHAYVEVDPETNAIRALLIPLEAEVSGLNQLPGGDVEVELEPSSAKHYLRVSNPSFGQFIELLKSSQTACTPVLVTEDPASHEIIDVRFAPAEDQEANPLRPATPLVAPAIAKALEAIEEVQAVVQELLVRRVPVTQQRANDLFDLASDQTCLPAAIDAPCITFLYPDDGCWARAQQMCDIFLGSGESPEKVWNYGDLEVNTRNNPHCKVTWVYHVAPIVQVTNGGAVENQVIDPSLFSAPVTVATWIAIQGDPTATQATSDASVFYRSPKGKLQFDSTGSKTAKELKLCRLRFKLRCASVAGPPPYSACP